MCSVVFAVDIWLREPWGWHCPAVFLVSMCVVVPCACSVVVALLAWHCGLNYNGSLAVLSIPFCVGYNIYIGRGSDVVCPVVAMDNF